MLQVKSDLIRHEDFKEFAYPDPLSKLANKYKHLDWGDKPARELLPGLKEEDGIPWTVGVGFTYGVTPDSRMDRCKAERMLEEKILEMDETLRKALPWYKDTSFVTKTILVNMGFNLGIVGLLGFRNTLAFVKAQNYKQAAANMRLSLWFSQTGTRAKELAKRMETQSIEPQHLVKDII